VAAHLSISDHTQGSPHLSLVLRKEMASMHSWKQNICKPLQHVQLQHCYSWCNVVTSSHWFYTQLNLEFLKKVFFWPS